MGYRLIYSQVDFRAPGMKMEIVTKISYLEQD